MVEEQEGERRKEQNRKARDKQNLIDEGLRQIMQTPQGRAWMWSQLEFCGPFRSPFAQSADVTAFQCGQQNVGLLLLGNIMRLCPDEYLTMAKENSDG